MRLSILPACLPLALAVTGLAACNFVATSDKDGDNNAEGRAPAALAGADSMASRDPAPGEAGGPMQDASAGFEAMQAQVVLDRLGFSVGVVDGAASPAFTLALQAFQEARGLPVSGVLDTATRQALARWSNIPATRQVTIPEDWGRIVFAALPEDPAAQARLTRLGYESMIEKLAERFHTTPAVLAALNPVTSPTPQTSPTGSEPAAPAIPAFAPGGQLRVPNVGADHIDPRRIDAPVWLDTLRALGVGTDQPTATRLVVDESAGWLRVYDAKDQMVAAFRVSTGSRHDPLPIGEWEVKGIARNPTFVYNPELFWDVDDSADKQVLPPGPNSPVGVVWIDLSKEHYGLHGTPAPELIGQTQSHGCVRLTNWDAARLAQMVKGGVAVVFRR